MSERECKWGGAGVNMGCWVHGNGRGLARPATSVCEGYIAALVAARSQDAERIKAQSEHIIELDERIAELERDFERSEADVLDAGNKIGRLSARIAELERVLRGLYERTLAYVAAHDGYEGYPDLYVAIVNAEQTLSHRVLPAATRSDALENRGER